MSKILVTGSKGFIGRHLLNNLDSNNVIEFNKSNGQDICDENCLKQIKDISLIYHLAAMASMDKCEKDPKKAQEINVHGTKNILELAKRNNAKIIFMSSAAVYGTPKYLPIDENHPTETISVYGRTKLEAENIIKESGVPYTIIRAFNIYGPNQNELFLIPTIIKQIKTGKVTLKNSKSKRDYVHISDLISALIKAKDSKQNTIINIGSGKSYNVREVIDMIKNNLDSDIKVEYLSEPKGVLNIYASISKAKQILNWEPKTLLVNGLKKLL